MKNKRLQLLLVLSFLATNVYADNAIKMVKANDELQWINMPNSPGKYVVVVGDPNKEGLFVIRVKFPPNHSIPPHHHDHYEYDTVISGSCHIAKGKSLKKENGLLATAGTFVAIPPQIIHYGWTDSEGAIIQLSGMGPWKPKYE